MKNSLLKSGLFLSFLFVVFFVLDKWCTEIVPKNTALKNYWILDKKGSFHDIAFIGPSRVLHSINGNAFKKNEDDQIINLGLSGAGYAEQYLILMSFLKNRNKIDQLLIEVSYFNFINPDSSFSYPFHEYFYFPYIQDDDVYRIISDNAKSKIKCLFWKYFPLFRYAEFNSEFRPMLLFKSPYNKKAKNSFDEFGTVFLAENADTTLLKDVSYNISEMNEKTIGYLERMVLLAQKNNIKVSFFTSPVYGNKVLYKNNAFINYKNRLNGILEKYEIDYFDFEDHVISRDITNFKDYTHINKKGAEIFSRQLVDAIRKFNG